MGLRCQGTRFGQAFWGDGMSDEAWRRVALHAILIMVFGMVVGGAPLTLFVIHQAYLPHTAVAVPGDIRGWKMAHLEGLLNGLFLLGLGVASRVRPLAPARERWLVRGLLVSGWGNSVASGLAPILGVRGMAMNSDPSNDLVALMFTIALVGTLVAVGLIIAHLWRPIFPKPPAETA